MMDNGERGYGNHAKVWSECQLMNAMTQYGLAGEMSLLDQRSNRRRRDEENASAKGGSTSNSNIDHNGDNKSMNECDNKRLKSEGSGGIHGSKGDREGHSLKVREQPEKPSDPPKEDYVHVRARRGQATDSHSLAERARREKITERMKILQDIVPGCNKVTGRALVLDEIINYVQSLQRQVEFLSMKLEAVNGRSIHAVEGISDKDFAQQAFDTSGMTFDSQAIRDEYSTGVSPKWLHMQIGETATLKKFLEQTETV